MCVSAEKGGGRGECGMEHQEEIKMIVDVVACWLPSVLSEIVAKYTDSSAHVNAKFHQFLVSTGNLCQHGTNEDFEIRAHVEVPWFLNTITQDVCGNVFLNETLKAKEGGVALGEWVFTDVGDSWTTEWIPTVPLQPTLFPLSWPIKIGNLFDSLKLSMCYTPSLQNPKLKLGIANATPPPKFQSMLC